MNNTALEGQGQSLAGTAKEGLGNVTGDRSLQGSGIADQLTGNAKQFAGAAKEAIGNPAPMIDKAKGFAKERPFATAALVGVVGMALLNTLRGR